MSQAPHDQVYARIGVSAIHGVGVLAITPIPKGTNIFPNDAAEITWVDRAAVERLSEPLKRLYFDFGIARGGELGVPANFNLVTPGWYLNEPAPGEAPNVAMSPDFECFALRDIAPGEELTTVYRTFSERGD